MPFPSLSRWLKPGLVAGLLSSSLSPAWAQATPPTPTVCVLLASSAWPASRAERQRILREMDALSDRCAGSAAFLALFGALLLDEGEPGQALLWLERAILLDPSVLGARVDHALALAALGEPAARDDLLAGLANRDDVPPPVMRRLRESAVPRLATASALEFVRPGRWFQRGEISVKQGRDGNLDRSPVLDGITLTSPDGPIDLPLAIPLRPRAGSATVGEVAWRLAYDTGQGALWQASGALAARHAAAEPDTDWQFGQLRLDHWQAWGPWRTQVHLGLGRSTGPLNEPYSTYRLGAALERDVGACTGRAAVEVEARRQLTSSYLDGNLLGGLASWQCRLAAVPGWRLGTEIRVSSDEPQTADRPGGRQLQMGATVRIAGKLGRWGLEASGTTVRADDKDGYSPLLQNNARRSFRQRQFQIELSHPLHLASWGPAEAFLQWNDARQTSNIDLFSDAGSNVYAGLRWRW